MLTTLFYRYISEDLERFVNEWEAREGAVGFDYASMDDDDAEAAREARRGPFRFSMIGVEPGAKICFYNDESVVAELVDDRSIRYGDEVMSLSKAAAIS